MADFLTTALGTSEVAHALKAPLITMEKALSLLREPGTGPLTDTQRKFLAIAERNLGLVSSVLGDFLDLARLDTGNLRLLRKPGAVDGVARQIVQETQISAAAKHLTITLAPVADGAALPPAAFDPSRLAQAVAHVMTYAVAAAPANGVITVETRARAPWVEIVITASGVILSPEALEHLFERHIPSDGKADAAGFGLGLPLAKGLIELHQGRIAATSDHAGTTWVLSLPVERSAPGP